MVFIKEHEYLDYIKKCIPIKKIVAPFGINGLMLKLVQQFPSAKIITNKKGKKALEEAGFKEVLSWQNMHAKVLIGEGGALWGSWNFSAAHERAFKHEELMSFITAKTTEYFELEIIFDRWWDRAKSWNR